MRRARFFLVIIFLAAPMLRECCLPTVTIDHCDQSRNSDNRRCSPNPVAITENRTGVAVLTADVGFKDGIVSDSWPIESISVAAGELTFAHIHVMDLYLRTGALLI